MLPVVDVWGLGLRELGERASAFRLIVIVQEILLVLAAVLCAVAAEQRRGCGRVVGDKPLAYFGERGRRGFSVPRIFSNTLRGWNVSMKELERRLCRITCAGVLHTTKIGSPANENSHIG